MPEPLALLAVLVLLALGAVAVRAVLDGRLTGVPASVAVLAPLAEAARAVRAIPLLPRGGAAARLAALGLLATAVARVLLLPIGGPPPLGTPAGIGALVLLDLLAWGCWWGLGRDRAPFGRVLLRAVVVELPVVAALAAPAVAAGSLRLAAIAGRPALAVEMPVAPLVLLAVTGLLAPWSAPLGAARPLAGLDRLLAGAARAGSLAGGAAVVAAVFLGGAADASGIVRVVVGTAVLLLVMEVGARRFPVLRGDRAAVVAAAVLLPLAALQLAVVAALALLAA